MSQKIKLVHILPNLNRGGAEKVVYDLLSSLDQTQFSLSLILFNDAGQGQLWRQDLEERGIKVIALKKRAKFDLLNFFALYRALVKIKPDLVHTHLGGDLYGRLTAYLAGVKLICSTIHNVNLTEPKLVTRVLRWSRKLNSAYFAVSEAVKKDAISRYKLNAKQIEVVYNGIDLNYFKAKKTVKKDREKGLITLGAIGRLSQQKGFASLIGAVAMIKEVKFKLLIAGAGELEADLKRQIEDLGLVKKVKLVGLVEPKAFYEQIDLFVLPSLWEGLGLVVLEAIAMKLPLIVSATGGVLEIVSEQSAYLYKPGNVKELAQMIRSVIENIEGSEVAEKVGQAFSLLEAKFSLQAMSANYTKHYLQLVTNNN